MLNLDIGSTWDSSNNGSHLICRLTHFIEIIAIYLDRDIAANTGDLQGAGMGIDGAMVQMVSHGRRQIRTVVIYTPTAEPTAPCGACRQVLNEFGPRARVVSVCDGPGYLDTTLDRLLPHAFGPGNLSGLT